MGKMLRRTTPSTGASGVWLGQYFRADGFTFYHSAEAWLHPHVNLFQEMLIISCNQSVWPWDRTTIRRCSFQEAEKSAEDFNEETEGLITK